MTRMVDGGCGGGCSGGRSKEAWRVVLTRLGDIMILNHGKALVKVIKSH